MGLNGEVIGVLTHLDSFKENKQLRKAKKSYLRCWMRLEISC